MKVQKRNGSMENVSFDKILNRIQLLCQGEEFSKKLYIDPTTIAQRVVNEIYDGVTTSKLDEEQLFYGMMRGINEEDSINMIEAGFCKDVFQKLPMEFAVEANKLLEVSMEGSVG